MITREFIAYWPPPMPERMAELQNIVMGLAEYHKVTPQLLAPRDLQLLDMYRGYCSGVDIILRLVTAPEERRDEIAAMIREFVPAEALPADADAVQ
jgi:hypothetical protein